MASRAPSLALLGLSLFVAGFFLTRRDGGLNEEEEDMIEDLDFDGLIGNTPMIEVRSLSKLTGCRIMAKMECRNPGGSGKDRPAKYMLKEMVREAKTRGRDAREIQVVESTSGNTGISLAALCKNLGLELYIVMPDDQSIEKRKKLEALGAKVKVVENCSIANAKHYVNEARRLATDLTSLDYGVHLNQFENLANTLAHEETTGPELLRQCPQLDAFVMSAGTGGTIAGVSRCARRQEEKEQGEALEVVLADPQGSSLYHKVVNGVCLRHNKGNRSSESTAMIRLWRAWGWTE